MINLGSEFERAVLSLAGINPDVMQQDSVHVDFIPETGPATIFYGGVATVDAEQLRALIRDAVPITPVES